MSPKRILSSLVMAALIMSAPVPAPAAKEAPEPVGQVTIKITEVGLGLGVAWGEGFLTYMGNRYKFKVKGLNAIAVGLTSVEARGEVYNLKNLDDFAGKYVGVGQGAALVKGPAGMVVKNFNGVVLNLKASQTGLKLKIANEGLNITPAWD